MEIMGITGVAGIVVICYLVGLIVKATPWNNNKIIPIVCGMAGAVQNHAAPWRWHTMILHAGSYVNLDGSVCRQCGGAGIRFKI